MNIKYITFPYDCKEKAVYLINVTITLVSKFSIKWSLCIPIYPVLTNNATFCLFVCCSRNLNFYYMYFLQIVTERYLSASVFSICLNILNACRGNLCQLVEILLSLSLQYLSEYFWRRVLFRAFDGWYPSYIDICTSIKI